MFLSSCRQEGPAVLDPALFANAGDFLSRISVSKRLGVSHDRAVLRDVGADGFAIDGLLCL